jgi:hypothetical protein
MRRQQAPYSDKYYSETVFVVVVKWSRDTRGGGKKIWKGEVSSRKFGASSTHRNQDRSWWAKSVKFREIFNFLVQIF